MAAGALHCQQKRELRRQQGLDLAFKFVLPNMPPNLSDHERGLVLYSAINALVIEAKHFMDAAAEKRAEELKNGQAAACNNDDNEEDAEMQIMVS